MSNALAVNSGPIKDKPRVVVHSGLRTTIAALLGGLANLGYGGTFDADLLATTSSEPHVAMLLLPATNEPELQTLRQLRPHHCLLPIAAVVSDNLGYQTYEAIRAGASGVINVMLPLQAQLAAAAFQLAATPAGDLIPTQESRAASSAPAAVAEIGSAASGIEAEMANLVRGLCSNRSVAEMARAAYCSERSMYRRIRQAYLYFGVKSRTELKLRMAASPVTSGPNL